MKDLKLKGVQFFNTDEVEWEPIDKGIHRQMLGFNAQIMMVKIKFEEGTLGYVHHHFHSQATYVASGKFKITINGESKILNEGDGFFVQPNLEHGAECLKAGMLIDVFSPLREDFLE